MSPKKTKQWFIDCPWGKLAMVSWGDESKPPILAVHGYLDSAATFSLLINSLPDSYFYVALDFPGHGRSDPFPNGVVPSQIHLVEAIRIAIKKLNWDRFIYMAHSMACIIGIHYNAAFSGHITKIINLDPVLPFNFQVIVGTPVLMDKVHADYYNHLNKFNNDSYRHYTYEHAINAVERARNLTTEQAEIVLSRILIPVGNGLFRLSWDQKMKKIVNLHLPRETFVKMLASNNLPILTIMASEVNQEVVRQGLKVLQEIQNLNDNFFMVYVDGGHDVHLTHPERVAVHIREFLERDFNTLQYYKKNSKL